MLEIVIFVLKSRLTVLVGKTKLTIHTVKRKSRSKQPSSRHPTTNDVSNLQRDLGGDVSIVICMIVRLRSNNAKIFQSVTLQGVFAPSLGTKFQHKRAYQASTVMLSRTC